MKREKKKPNQRDKKHRELKYKIRKIINYNFYPQLIFILKLSRETF